LLLSWHTILCVTVEFWFPKERRLEGHPSPTSLQWFVPTIQPKFIAFRFHDGTTLWGSHFFPISAPYPGHMHHLASSYLRSAQIKCARVSRLERARPVATRPRPGSHAQQLVTDSSAMVWKNVSTQQNGRRPRGVVEDTPPPGPAVSIRDRPLIPVLCKSTVSVSPWHYRHP
jgi:hypothetical protein